MRIITGLSSPRDGVQISCYQIKISACTQSEKERQALQNIFQVYTFEILEELKIETFG